jgi:hypothetical protein
VKRATYGAAIIACLWAASPVWAGLYDDIYQGLLILSTPSGYPLLTAADGTRFNGQRSGRLQIQPNVPGNGYDVQFNRVFGLDSQGRPEVLDLGNFELQLAGATQATFGYTHRGPLIGTANITANNLNYSLRAKSGIQDATLSGTLNVAENIEINQFGFYEASINVSNTDSQLLLNGSLAQETIPENFDIGPINVKGNIFFDAFVALLSSLGLDTTQLQKLTPGSAIGQIIDDITQQVPALVAGAQVSNEGQLPLDPADMDIVPVVPAVDVLPAQSRSALAVPEPGTLLLLGMGVFLWQCKRR